MIATIPERTEVPEHLGPEPTAEDVEVSVVMPCLNESRTVGVCIDKANAALKDMEVLGEIVIADNGSGDGSPDIAKEHGARVVHVPCKGYGAALQAGIAAARGKFIIMGDADDSYDFTQLQPFVEKLRAGDDLVMGNRFRGGIKPGAMPWHHKYIGNPVLTGILNLFFHSPIGDAHCGMRGFRKDANQRLKLTTTGMEFASEMVVKACLHRQKISEVPIVLHPDGRDRPPHLRSFRDGWRHLRFLLLYCPVWLYLIPAFVFLGIGLGQMAWQVVRPGFGVNATLLGIFSVFLGYQALWLWVYARVQGANNGMLPADSLVQKIVEYLYLERGLLIGVGMVLTGIVINASLTMTRTGSFSAAEIQATIRFALWSTMLVVLGIQTIFGSFFLNMLQARR